MKISFTTMATPELDIPAQVAAAKEYGFHGVDFRVIERGAGEIQRQLSKDAAEQVKSNAKGVELPSLLCYNEKIQAGHETMVRSLLEYTHLAVLLGIPAIRIFTGKIQDERELEMLIGVLREVLGSDDTGTVLAMQNHINSSVTLHQAREVCRRIDDARVRMILSPDQADLIGEDYLEILPGAAPYAYQLYVADMKDGHHVLPGTGTLPYDGIVRTLQDNGFDGFVTLKWERCWHPELPPYGTAFEAFLQEYGRWTQGRK